MEDPTRILPLMMDFGFDARMVRMFRLVLTEDEKDVKDYFRCSANSESEIIYRIADYCYVSEYALKEVLCGIKKNTMSERAKSTIGDEGDSYSKSAKSIAKYGWNRTYLTHVDDVDFFTIPDSVTSIGSDAFRDCISLREVVIPNTVTDIHDYTFSGCKSLRRVTIPDSVWKIGTWAFGGCSSLREVKIPNSVTRIDDSAFSGCISALFNVSENNYFYSSECGSLFDKKKEELIKGYSLVHNGVCEISDHVTMIADFAFRDCVALKKIKIPKDVWSIGGESFAGCYSTSFDVDDENTSFSSESGALFNGRKDVLCIGYPLVHNGECVIPDHVTMISDYAFYGCTYLKKVRISSPRIWICENAFCGCKNVSFDVEDGSTVLPSVPRVV